MLSPFFLHYYRYDINYNGQKICISRSYKTYKHIVSSFNQNRRILRGVRRILRQDRTVLFTLLQYHRHQVHHHCSQIQAAHRTESNLCCLHSKHLHHDHNRYVFRPDLFLQVCHPCVLNITASRTGNFISKTFTITFTAIAE